MLKQANQSHCRVTVHQTFGNDVDCARRGFVSCRNRFRFLLERNHQFDFPTQSRTQTWLSGVSVWISIWNRLANLHARLICVCICTAANFLLNLNLSSPLLASPHGHQSHRPRLSLGRQPHLDARCSAPLPLTFFDSSVCRLSRVIRLLFQQNDTPYGTFRITILRHRRLIHRASDPPLLNHASRPPLFPFRSRANRPSTLVIQITV